MDKPLDWDPIDEGKQVTLDHDYRRPGTERKANPKEVPDIGRRGQGKGGLFRTMELRPEDLENARPEPLLLRRGEQAKPVPAAARNERKPEREDKADPAPESPVKPDDGEEKKPAPKATLLRGAEAYHEFEAERQAEKDARSKESPHPTPGDSGKLAGADSAPPPTAKGDDGKFDAATAGAGAAGGMVKPRGQHGKGKLTSSDPTIKDLINKYGEKPDDFKKRAKQELDELSEQAKQAKSPKERNKLLRRKDAIKGAIKLMDRYFLKMPLLLTPFTEEQLRQISNGVDPDGTVI